jgi:nicotinamidase-related amidase
MGVWKNNIHYVAERACLRQQIIVEKQVVDVFTNPNIDGLLGLITRDRRVVLYGVVTEICVERAARGFITRGYTVDVVGDAMQRLDASKTSCSG